jgi:HPt (histidine-containing phosphotransfer) domain-containing protein
MSDDSSSGGVVDWQAAEEQMGSEQTLLGVAEVFLEQLPRVSGRIRTALRLGDAAGVREAAHMLKGSLGIFDMRTAAALARELESCAAGDDLDAARAAWERLELRLQALEDELEERLRARTPRSA